MARFNLLKELAGPLFPLLLFKNLRKARLLRLSNSRKIFPHFYIDPVNNDQNADLSEEIVAPLHWQWLRRAVLKAPLLDPYTFHVAHI